MEEQSHDGHPATSDAMRSGARKTVIAALVAGVFVIAVLAKVTIGSDSQTPITSQSSTASITSTHNDAYTDYQVALETDKPVYVLFHSLTCEPCIEISEVADKVVLDYGDKVVFVNAITDDASAQRLAARFSFQYIPTSFFIRADGTVAESFTGAMDEAQMRAHLDGLVGEK